MSLSHEDYELLISFVKCVFTRWYGLQAAIQNGMGGSPAETKSKLDDMAATIATLCSRPGISDYDISDALEDIADSYFDVVFEDGSTDEVAHHLWSDTQELLTGNRDKMRTFVTNNTTQPIPVIPAPSEPVEEEMDTDNVASAEKAESCAISNDDGWEVPRYARRKR